MAFSFAGQWGPEPTLDRFGNAVYSATFRVLTTAGAEATVYTDRTKATTVSQPLDVDGEGNATFYAAPGRYTVELTAGGSVTSFPVGVVPDAEDVEPAPDVATQFAATAWRTGELVFDVTHPTYGAVGDFTNDDTAAIQAAIDAAIAAGGGVVFFPKGRYRITAPLNLTGDMVTFKGVARSDSASKGSVINSETTDLFTAPPGAYRRYIVFEDIELIASTASSGHIFNNAGSVSFWTWNRCRLRVENPAKSIIQHVVDADFLDNVMMDCYLSVGSGTTSGSTWTVPAVNIISNTGGINVNAFWRLRCEYSGVPFFHLESTHAAAYTQDNTFRDINFEITNGGNIEILSGRNNIIENCNTYDLQVVGPTTQHLYQIGKSSVGPISRGNAIRNSCRRSGALGAGLFDIALIAGGVNTTEINGCNGEIDLGTTTAMLLNLLTTDSPAAVVTNRETRTVEIDYAGVRIGGTGLRISQHWSQEFTNDFGSIAAQSEAGLNVTVTGALLGDAVTITPNGAPELGLIWEAFVSATNIVRVRLINYTTAAIDPAPRTFRLTVTRY